MIPKFITNPDPSIYENGIGLCIDIETTNNHKGDARYDNEIICYSTKMVRSATDDGSKPTFSTSIPNLVKLLSKREFDFIIVHGGKFELKYFHKLGIRINEILVYDTLLSEKIIASNRPWRLGLGDVHKRYGGGGKEGLVDVLIKGQICPSEIPSSLIKRRVVKDVQDTVDVFVSQIKVLKDKNLLGCAYTKSIFSPVVADMEMSGMYLDCDLVREIATKDNLELFEIQKELDSITGGINLASSKQKAEFIYGELGFDIPKLYGKEYLTPKGLPSTDEMAMSMLKPRNKKQKRFLELIAKDSKLRKRISTYHSLFIRACEENNNYIFGSINQEITVTQRLSSSSPNLQNIDRSLKKVITSRFPGWKIRQNDYSQLEFRVAGYLSQCPVALRDIINKEDVHSNTAEVLFDGFVKEKKKEPEMDKLRTEAKSKTFKPLYGGESGTDRERAYYEWFKKNYTGISSWHRNLMTEAVSNNIVTTETGLIFYFPNTRRMQSGNVTKHTAIKNYPVQYFATGEIAVIGALILWHYMKAYNLQSFMINEVHDSVIIEEHPDEHEIMEKLSHKAMTEDTIEYLYNLYGIKYNFPLDIETEVNTNWSYDK